MDNTEVLEHEEKSEKKDKTIAEVIDTMNEEQKTVFYAVVGEALKSKGDDEAKHSDNILEIIVNVPHFKQMLHT